MERMLKLNMEFFSRFFTSRVFDLMPRNTGLCMVETKCQTPAFRMEDKVRRRGASGLKYPECMYAGSKMGGVGYGKRGGREVFHTRALEIVRCRACLDLFVFVSSESMVRVSKRKLGERKGGSRTDSRRNGWKKNVGSLRDAHLPYSRQVESRCRPTVSAAPPPPMPILYEDLNM